MTVRIPFASATLKDAQRALLGLSQPVRLAGLEPELLELVKIRVSQLNGCGFCLDMHSKDARAHGVTEQRIYLLGAWRETKLYTPRERAALRWAEAVTRLEHQEVPDAVYEQVRAVFTEEELIGLTLAVVQINGWNRFAIAFRYAAGDYEPGSLAAARSA